MKITYTAIDGYNLDGNETFASLMAEDSIQGANLLSNPSNVNSWTTGNSATITQQDNRTIKLTNGAASYGYATQAITTEANTYYLFRVYVYKDDGNTCRIQAGTTAGSSTFGNTTASSDSKVHELIVRTSVTTTYFTLWHTNVDGAYSYWSNIEVIKLNHYGVDETTDYITNGTFDSTTTGWSVTASSGTGAISIVSGELLVDNNSSANRARAYQAVPCVVGLAYKVSVDVTALDSSAALFVSTTVSTANEIVYKNTTSVETIEVNFVATATTMYVVLMCDSATTTDTATFDNCVMTESGNLVGNGDFGVDAVWTLGGGATISGGVLNATTVTANQSQTISVTKGYYYNVSFEIKSRSAGDIRINNTTGCFAGHGNPLVSAVQVYNYTMLCTDDTQALQLYLNGFTGTIDNVTVRRAYPVLDSNGNAAEIYGEIVEVPVNYNSTTVASSNWSSDNYLKMPYSSDLDPGTGDLSFSFWIKTKTSGTQGIFQRDSESTAQNYRSYIDSTGRIFTVVDDDTTERYADSSSGPDYGDETWHHIVATYDQSAGLVSLYIDGALIDTTSGSALNTLTNTSAVLYIGGYITTSIPFGGYIAGIKIDIGNVWTAQKVKSDYESEKVLYNQNELYSIVDNNLVLAIGVKNSHPGQSVKLTSSEAVDGTREYIIKNRKQTYSLTSIPVNFSNKNKLLKFIKSTPGQEFTFSERSFEYGADNEKTVYIESMDNQITRAENANDKYIINFKVREK